LRPRLWLSAHRQSSDSVAPRSINESILVLLLRKHRRRPDEAFHRVVKPKVRSAQQRGEVEPGWIPGGLGEWIVRMLLSFELLPPIGVNLDSPRAVRRFVAEHIVAGLAGASRE
jgi:hypothetical protein